jgi:hypothetical protein
VGVKIYSVAGCVGIGNKEEEREGSPAECEDRTVYFHIVDQ